MGTLIQSRKELERRVDDLRAFEREYRRRFEAFLERQLSELREVPPDSGVFPPLPEDRPDPASDESGP